MPRTGSLSQENRITLLYVPDGPTGAIRRFHVKRSWLRGVASGWVVAAIAVCIAGVDYVKVRREVVELERLRSEASIQREEIAEYAARMDEIAGRLARLGSLEQKLRVITNLDPSDPMPLPGIGGIPGELGEIDPLHWASPKRRRERLKGDMEQLARAAEGQQGSIASLLEHMEGQATRLVHTPSIAPSTGWITSSFGYRTSPFTGNRELHRGIDIAGRIGTPIVATADGAVRLAGRKGGLGNAVILNHGYGVETIYGHLSEVLVRAGEKVKRGQKVGLMGNTGRSTGPHLHYQVEVNRKPANPRNYILE